MTDITKIETFGDVRQLILQTVMNVRDGALDVNQGMAMFAGLKVLNDNVQVEINAAKLALQTEGKLHNFGQVVRMGRKVINGASEEVSVLENKGSV